MISKKLMGQMIGAGVVVLALAGCDKKPEPMKTTSTETIQATQAVDSGPKTENDLYIERLNTDVTIENPDALLDAVYTDTAIKK